MSKEMGRGNTRQAAEGRQEEIKQGDGGKGVQRNETGLPKRLPA